MEQASQNPGSPAESPQETSLVVICRDERSVRSTVAFLNRRGIPTKIVTNMNDAVEMFSKKQANMALLSVNFPHPKIEMLPALLTQSFSVDTIVFAEDTDRKTTQKLSQAKARHVLFGPVSGPVVLMRVRQIEKENIEASAQPSESAKTETGAESGEQDSGAIKVGGGKGDQGDRIQVKSKRKSASDDGANLMKSTSEDEAGYQIARGEGLEHSGGTIVQKGTRASMKGATQRGPLDKTRRGELAARAFGRAIDRGLRAPSDEKKSKLFIPPPPWTTPEKEAELEAIEEAKMIAELEADEKEREREERDAREFAEAQEQAKARADAKEEKDRKKAEAAAEKSRIAAENLANREKKAAEFAEARERAAAEVKETKEREAKERDLRLAEDVAKATREREERKTETTKSPDVIESTKASDEAAAPTSAATESRSAAMSESKSQAEKTTKANEPENTSPAVGSAARTPSGGYKPVELRKARNKQEDLFLRCLTEAMSTVCGRTFGVSRGLAFMKAAGLVSVRSKRIEGAFVVEIGRSRLNPEALLQRIEVAFFSVIRNAGIDLGEGEQFAIELEDFEIVTNAFNASDYLMYSSSPDHEVAVAVIPVSNPTPKMEAHRDNMVKISVAEMPIETPVTFDVFLHLPSNKKYMRYLKVGGKMTGKQSDKLGRYKVGSLFLNEKDKEAYRKHYAAQSIDPKKKAA